MPRSEQYRSDGSSNERTKSYERQDAQGSATFIGLFLLASALHLKAVNIVLKFS